MLSKRIGREQTVIPHMPPGWMAWILRMIENRYAHRLSFGWSVVIAPIRPCTPAFIVTHIRARDDMTKARLSFRTFQSHRFRHSNRHRSVLVISKRQVAFPRV